MMVKLDCNQTGCTGTLEYIGEKDGVDRFKCDECGGELQLVPNNEVREYHD